MYKTAETAPGIIPAISSLPIDWDTMRPYRHIIMLGGIREDRVPLAATTPAALESGYPAFLILGIADLPITAHADIMEPEAAAKTALEATVPIASPPGNCPTHFSIASKRSSRIPDRYAIVPINTKAGITLIV
jgi:hypothetical protein